MSPGSTLPRFIIPILSRADLSRGVSPVGSGRLLGEARFTQRETDRLWSTLRPTWTRGEVKSAYLWERTPGKRVADHDPRVLVRQAVSRVAPGTLIDVAVEGGNAVRLPCSPPFHVAKEQIEEPHDGHGDN